MGETLTNINKLRNPNYLGSWDLQDPSGKMIDIIVTIKEVLKEEAFNIQAQEKEEVVTVHFVEVKPMILNATNMKTIIKVTGTEFIEEMVGKKIQLTTKKVKAFGEVHDAIRIVTKLSSQLTTAQAPKIVDEGVCIASLEKATDVATLGEIWISLSKEEKANPSVLAKKDELKKKFTDDTQGD